MRGKRNEYSNNERLGCDEPLRPILKEYNLINGQRKWIKAILVETIGIPIYLM